jgi:hypothetical protein
LVAVVAAQMLLLLAYLVVLVVVVQIREPVGLAQPIKVTPVALVVLAATLVAVAVLAQ